MKPQPHLLLTIACLIILSCTPKTYENKARYNLKIGETVEIYYSTNSCCYFCFAEEQDLKHIEFIEERTVDNSSENCAGCDLTYSFVFRAKSAGIDTVKLKHSAASKPCEEADMDPYEYIVEVREVK